MPPQDPQERINEAARMAQGRMSSQIQSEIDAEMRQRFGVDLPTAKTLFDTGVVNAAGAKEGGGDQAAYLKILEDTQKRMMAMAQIQRREGNIYLEQLKKVSDMETKAFKREVDRLGLIKNRKQIMEDITELENKGGDISKVSAGAQQRILEARGQVAESMAMNTPGITTGSGAGGILTGLAMRGGVRGWIGRQGLETKTAITEAGSITGAIPRIIAANPVLSILGGAALAYRGFNEGQGLNIPFVGSVPGTAFQQQILSGQTTGEGYRAGLGAEFSALKLGMNPFDTITMQVAHSIVQAVRSQGFRGAMARGFEDSIASAYKDLGVDVNLLAQIGEQFARRGRFDEFRAAMQNLDQIAKDTGTSVQAVAEQLKNVNDQLMAGGGIANAPIAQGIVGGVNRAFPQLTAEQRSGVQQFTIQGLSMFSGLPSTIAQTPWGVRQGLNMLRPALQMYSQQFRAMGPSTGAPNAAQQRYIGQLRMIPAFANLDYGSLLHILRNPDYVDSIQRGANRTTINAAFQAAHGRIAGEHGDLMKQFFAGDLTYDQLKGTERRDYVRTLARRLGETSLTRQQVERIISPLRAAAAGHGDWGQTLSHAGEMARRYSDTHAPKTQIGIKLDAGETRKFLSGKNVSKSINLQKSFEGAISSLGTSLVEPF